jgi:hypothetical protein
MIPPTDDELRKMLNVADDPAMRVFVRDRLTEAKQQQEDQRIEARSSRICSRSTRSTCPR